MFKVLFVIYCFVSIGILALKSFPNNLSSVYVMCFRNVTQMRPGTNNDNKNKKYPL